ncbi:hypothetical protein V6N13_124026 [Hibiscus sabdariffa]
MASARYAMVSAKSRWEEQGFQFDNTLPNYGPEQFVYNRINELGWFRFARQPARANYNWVLEFYANNADGEDFSIVHGRRVPATAAIINDLLGLPNDTQLLCYAGRIRRRRLRSNQGCPMPAQYRMEHNGQEP